MNFWDEEREEIIKNCLNCNSSFNRKRGVGCSASCFIKKLENEHRKLVDGMIYHCLPKKKVIFIYESKTFLVKKRKRIEWGWTEDINQEIHIHWYTLRSKKHFFDTISHEIGHIMAYEQMFSLTERKILERFFLLIDKQEKFHKDAIFDDFCETTLEIRKIIKEKKKIIDKYKKWEGHDYKPWYEEYENFHKKLLDSDFRKYAYGNLNPVPYDLIIKGENNGWKGK